MTNEIEWSENTWKDINNAVLVEVGKVRAAQKVFPTTSLDDNPVQVPDELISFLPNLSIREGQTKPFVEIFATFTLTSTQVKQEDAQKTGKTLARMAAKALALAEDMYFFQSSAEGPRDPGNGHPALPANTQIENWRLADDLGLLRAANARRLQVNRAQPPNPNTAQWGNNTFTQVAAGIALLVGQAQAAPYALILPTEAYADTFIPPSADSLVTPADRIKPLMDGGFYTSPVLQPNEGLLVALAGDPVSLFVGREVLTEFVVRQGNNFVFRVVERVQYVVRDPRSLVLLQFTPAEEEAVAPRARAAGRRVEIRRRRR